jgi:hypothetical protein
MAELLVKASGHWMDKLTESDVAKMSAKELEIYKARHQPGDVIVVRPDGWKWGKRECLPEFIVVKVPELSIEDAQEYVKPLMNGTTPIRHCKYAFPKTDIDSAISTTASVTEFAKTVFDSKLITKTGLASEISSPTKEA